MTLSGVPVGGRKISDFGPFTRSRAFWGALLIFMTGVFPALGQDLSPASEPAPESRVALAQFTTAIENREPVDQVTFVENDVQTIFFYTDLRDLTGQTINHRWRYDGSVMADVSFEVRGPRWRVWSSKDLQPDWIGDWTVEIVTAEGEVIASETFTLTAPGS